MKNLFFKKRIAAFSLVEILVVLGLFSSISTLSLAALFNTQAINGRLQETQAILDNINLSTQTISRDIRFGSNFYCAVSVPSSTTSLPTVRRNCLYGTGGGGVLIYRSGDATNDLDRSVLYVDNGVLYKEEYPYGGDPVVLQMTANDVFINSLLFYVDGAQTADGSNDDSGAIDYKQPLVTLLISGVTKPAKTSIPSTSFNVETSISVREIDNQ